MGSPTIPDHAIDPDRFAELGRLWDEKPGHEYRADAFVDICVELAEGLETPFPVVREALAQARRDQLGWAAALYQILVTWGVQ